jgi:hypothetical protein
MIKVLQLILISTILTSCSTTLTANGAKVRVVRHSEKTRTCKRLAEVKASSMMGGLFAGMAYEKSINEVKNQTAEAGGNVVELLDSHNGWSGTNMIGNAYLCKEMP